MMCCLKMQISPVAWSFSLHWCQRKLKVLLAEFWSSWRFHLNYNYHLTEIISSSLFESFLLALAAIEQETFTGHDLISSWRRFPSIQVLAGKEVSLHWNQLSKAGFSWLKSGPRNRFLLTEISYPEQISLDWNQLPGTGFSWLKIAPWNRFHLTEVGS